MADRMNLTGAWFGRFAYAGGTRPPVAFWASVEEADGGIAGWTSEPNTVGDGSPLLNATIAGERRGRAVEFTKAYDGASDLAHAVAYEGQLDLGGERIVGQWRLTGETGAFEMRRTHADGEEDAVDHEETVDERA